MEPPQVAAPLNVWKLEIQVANEQREKVENEVQTIAAKIKEVEQQMARRATLYQERCKEHARLEAECKQAAGRVARGEGAKVQRQPEPPNTRQTSQADGGGSGRGQTATAEARAAGGEGREECSGRRAAPVGGQVGRAGCAGGASAPAPAPAPAPAGSEAHVTGGHGSGTSHLHFVERRGQAGAREPRAGRWDTGGGRGEERKEEDAERTRAVDAEGGATAGGIGEEGKRRLEIDDGTLLQQSFFFLDAGFDEETTLHQIIQSEGVEVSEVEEGELQELGARMRSLLGR